MNVGERIKAARIFAGLTQEELGSCCGASKQTIFKYETGVITNIPLDKVELIAARLNVSPAYLMGWDESADLDQVTDSQIDNNLISLLTELTPDEIPLIVAYIQGIIAARKKE